MARPLSPGPGGWWLPGPERPHPDDVPMQLDGSCDSLARLPFPRADEPSHPERTTVLAARALVGEALERSGLFRRLWQ